MLKQWKLKPKISAAVREELSEFDDLTSQLLYNRGVVEPADARDFLHPSYDKLHSPFLFADMSRAVERVWEAVHKNQQIFIYGDYDADAVTANAVLRQTFRYLGVSAWSYIPDRFTEGYGVNIEALSAIRQRGAELVITVDCGTNSVEAADWCAENGLDFIITDHHEIIGQSPKAAALINPKNSEDTYPYRDITGVGVAFKLACALLHDEQRVTRRLSRADGHLPAAHIAGWEKWLLDLVAIGTVADCHSLLGENRILVKYGLQVLAKTRWPGLRALMRSAGLYGKESSAPGKIPAAQKPFDTYSLGFVLAPRLNAAGRLRHADIALDVLLEENSDAALQKARELESINQQRQDQTARMLSEAKEQVEFIKDRKILVVAQDGWSKGVVGLVAGRLAEEFHKPAFALAKENGEATGSARTVGAFNVVEALKFSSEHLVRFGGHAQAAGLTVKSDRLELFYKKILEYAESQPEAESEPLLELEAVFAESDLSQQTLMNIRRFEPFGVDNASPRFLVEQMRVVSLRPVGSALQHMQMQLAAGNTAVSAIQFNCSQRTRALQPGQVVDVAAEIMEDNWNGRQGIKLRIVDVRLAVQSTEN